MPGDRADEVPPFEGKQAAAGERRYGRRPWHIVEQGDLPEALAGSLPPAEAAVDVHLHLTIGDQVEALSWLTPERPCSPS
jgi:hypothetical protein